MIVDLRNAQDKHLGYILFPAGKPVTDRRVGDCVVRPLPRERELFQTDEFLYLDRLKNQGEHNFEYCKQEARLRIGEPPVLDFQIGTEGQCVDSVSGLNINGKLILKKSE